LYVPVSAVPGKRFPQTAHMHVDGSFLDIDVRAPNLVE
jgi:hypothetical protein